MKRVILKSIAALIALPARWGANRLHFKAAIRRAERLSRKKRKRHYVYFLRGKYRVYNRKDVQRLKNAGIIRTSLNLEKMRGVILYDTLGHVNRHPLYKNISLRGINIVYNTNTEQPCTLQ